MKITPLKLAAKFDPPTIALMYGKNNHKYMHEFLISSKDLTHSTDMIRSSLLSQFPEYLRDVDPEQIGKFVDILKQNQSSDSFEAKVGKHGIDFSNSVEGSYDYGFDDSSINSEDYSEDFL